MACLDFETITKISVVASVYEGTVEFLQSMGWVKTEGIVIWAGTPTASDCFLVDRAHIPRQTADAYGARVTADEMDRLFEKIYHERRLAVAQVHSHPGEAYHSEIDDELPILTRRGALSLVVPNFARGDAADVHRWASYRLGETGWMELNVNEILNLE